MSVRRAQHEINSAEFAEWMAYAVLEPFGPEREDQRAGMIAALIANVNRDPKTRPEPYTVEEFFPRYEDLLADLEGSVKEAPSLSDKLTTWALTMNAGQRQEKPGGDDGRSDEAAEAGGDGHAAGLARGGRGRPRQAGVHAGTQDALSS